MRARARTCGRPSAAFWQAYAELYGRQHNQRGYRRALLPDPATYYPKHLASLHARGDWADARCPFHDDESPSLSVSLTHGGYYCHACGAKGGDVLAFHRKLTGMTFSEAAKDLNAWEEPAREHLAAQ